MRMPVRRAKLCLLGGATIAVALLGAGTGVTSAHAETTAPAARTSVQACPGVNAPKAEPTSSLTPQEAASAAAGVRLPQDEAPHSDPNEWWYFSGHLWGTDPAGHLHCYGFEYVIFQFLDIAPEPVYFGDFSLTDLNRQSFQYAFEEDSYPVPATRDSFALHAGDWTMSGGSGRDALHADLPGYTLNLRLQTTEPAALHGQDGIIPFGPFGTSSYYSWTSLLSSGTIVDHGVTVKVGGLSWMDHQWGSFNFASGGGWDWFSMQLSNGQQYMLYFIRNESGQIVQTIGTRVDPGGRTAHLTAASFGEQATGSWTSPATGITYGSGWHVTVPGGSLTVTPDLLNQEVDLLSTQGSVYWEGDVSIKGKIDGAPVSGIGYTEINPPAEP
jgi:predicted secreted hydrolase